MTPPPSGERRGRISDQTKDQIKEASNQGLVDLISETVTLKPDGTTGYKGLCPFHNEKSPSFHVNPGTGTWHCFGCGEGGDAISFVQKINNADFIWAMEFLAARYGIPLGTDSAAHDSTTRLRRALQIAQEFYGQQLLATREDHPARIELEKRGFDIEQCVAEFGCGYAPDSSTAILKHLRQQGFKDEEIVAAGLAKVSEKSHKPWDFFRNRVTWAIQSTMGHVVGFGARRLSEHEKSGPKFLNTPETALYHKSSVLYGLADARRMIAKESHVYVVEGYADVMAFRVAGIDNVVAACGTAFTPDHLAVLRRLIGEAGEVTFALDDDAAGIKATMKVYDVARDSVKRLTVLPPSEGMDPDDYRKERGNEALRALMPLRSPLIGTVIRRTIEALPQETNEDRVAALGQVKPLFEHIRDPLLRDEYAKDVATILKFDPASVIARLSGKSRGDDKDLPLRGETEKVQRTSGSTTTSAVASLIERDLMAALVQNYDVAKEYIEDVFWTVQMPPSRKVAKAMQTALESPAVAKSSWPTCLMADEAVRPMVGMLSVLPLNVAPESVAAHVEELIDRLADEQRRDENVALTAEMKTATAERRLAILKIMQGV